MTGHNIHSRTLYKSHQRLESPCIVNTVIEAESKLIEELSNYRSIKTEAVSKRQSFLEELALKKADQASGADYDTVLKVEAIKTSGISTLTCKTAETFERLIYARTQ